MTKCKITPEINLAPDTINSENYKDYIEKTFTLFKKDFIDSEIKFLGRTVHIDNNRYIDGKSETFFHLICGDKKKPTNFRRTERVEFPASFIKNYLMCQDCEEVCKVKMFIKINKKKKRYHIFSEEHRYLVVLEDEGKKIKLVTGFYIDENYMIHKYNKDYDNYIKSLQNKDDAIL